MQDQDNSLFAEFPGVTKAEWLSRVEKDLKGRPLQELEWQLEENITLEPFFHKEEVQPVPIPGLDHRTANQWEIGEYIDVLEVKSANQAVKEGLQGGVEAPLFRLQKMMLGDQVRQLMDGIELTYISTHFSQRYADKKPWVLWEHFVAVLQKQEVDLKKVSGSLDFDPILDWTAIPFKELAALIKDCAATLPRFKILQVNARPFHHGIANTSRELAYTIAKGSDYLAKLDDLGLSPALVQNHMQFSVAISTSYFVEIAKLRALRVLWQQVLQAYEVTSSPPVTVEVHLAWESLADDPHSNMIRASTQAMSAVIGGADRLYVWPSNAGRTEYSNAFSRRIARNVQHLLKMESYFDRVVDPSAGSYYVEQLTRRLAGEAWQQFQEIEKQGGFLNL